MPVVSNRLRCVGVALAVGAFSALAHAEPVWNMAPGYAPGVFHTQNLQIFADNLTRASQGKLTVKVGELGKPYAMADIRAAVGSGKVDGGDVLGTSLAKEFPMVTADTVPFMVGSYAEGKRLWKYQRPLLAKSMSEKGLVLLYAVPWPPQGLYSVKPIQSDSDLSGMRMRTYNPATVRIAEMVHAKPVDIANGPPLTKALSEGTVDAMITSSATGVDIKAWERFPYFYDIRAWLPKNVVFVSKAAWDKLDPATQKLVEKAAAQAEADGWTRSEAVASDALDKLKQNKVSINATPPNMVASLRRFGEKFTREWIRSTGKESMDIFIPFYSHMEKPSK